ncbi:MAG: ribosomal-processing cysteine protease Prp [Tissierella sp.]|uniref:ribosomal-processing cysteine protease Prp n=1 Tax=Tissierella sp. TaxID=41274 RepID=UPI003F9B24D6
MIKIKLFSDPFENITQYDIKGHANFAPHGEDIVCAAISVLSQTTLMGLVEVLQLEKEEIFYKIDENTGYLNVKLKNIKNKEKVKGAQILLQTFKRGIESIQDTYPGNLKIEYRRCDR